MQDLIGLKEEHVQGVAESLFAATEQHPAVYWIYLAISAGIAFFGLGITAGRVFLGSTLLFIANLSAIILVAASSPYWSGSRMWM